VRIPKLHGWDVSFADAIALQRELAGKVKAKPALKRFQTIAGADVSYNRWSPTLYASVVVLKMPDLTVLEERTAAVDVAFPYRTGLLSFREAPALLAAFRKVRTRPDVVMIDGHGLAHPRRFGIASHLGLWLDVPTIGCAKTRLIGDFEEPDVDAGSLSPLTAGGERVGCVLRTKQRCKPLFISVGVRIDLESAIDIVGLTTRRHRIPEPTRLAHDAVNRYRRRCMAVKNEHE
jgi:deoxyribonuclease V